MKSYSKTDVGIKRTMNQDSLFCSDSPVGSFRNLFIVADGMGGHKAGDRASRLCIENMVAQVRESASKTPVTIFEEAITYANRAVYESAKEDIEFEVHGNHDGGMYITGGYSLCCQHWRFPFIFIER